MWKDDNDKILDILDVLDNKSNFETPIVCPICEKKEAHIYMYRRSNSAKGTVWVWCSECMSCAHERITIPTWWENDDFINSDNLTAHPKYLEECKEDIDRYLKKILNKNKHL